MGRNGHTGKPVRNATRKARKAGQTVLTAKWRFQTVDPVPFDFTASWNNHMKTHYAQAVREAIELTRG